MKYRLLLTFFIFLSVCSFAQTADGTFRLKSLNLHCSTQENPEIKANLRKSSKLNDLKENETRVGFQVFNFSSKTYEYKECLFLYEGLKCRIFSDDACLDKAKKYLQHIVSNFDNKVYPTVCSWFGFPVIPDNLYLPDNKIFIVLTSQLGNYSEGYIAGYFDHRDLEPALGNAKPVLFMDAINSDPSDFDSKSSGFYRTMAHELQHMINFSARKFRRLEPQERWLEEAYSMYAEYVYSGSVGINNEKVPSTLHLSEYLKNPSVELTDNSDKLWFNEEHLYRQYGAAFVFMAYLIEKYGGSDEALKKSFLRELVRETKVGVNGINDMLYKTNKTVDEIIFDMNMALSLDNLSLNNGYWGFENKHAVFASLSSVIPISQGNICNSGDIFILPSSFKEIKALTSENEAFSVCSIEIPIFNNKSIVAIKKK